MDSFSGNFESQDESEQQSAPSTEEAKPNTDHINLRVVAQVSFFHSSAFFIFFFAVYHACSIVQVIIKKRCPNDC